MQINHWDEVYSKYGDQSQKRQLLDFILKDVQSFFWLLKMLSYGFNRYHITVFENNRKVLFYIASDASYVYILIGQKLIENTKKTNMASFWKSKAFDQTVLPDRSLSIGQTLVTGGQCYFRTEMRHFWWFINTVQEDFSIENIVNFFSIFLVKFKFWSNSRFLDIISQLFSKKVCR